MANLLLTLILLANVILLALVLWSINKVKHVSQEVKAFITPVSDGKPSPLAITVDNISSVFARAFTAQIKTTLMGVESGIKRGEKAIQGDIAIDIARQSGGIGALLSQFPTVAKHIRRNPGLVDIGLQVLGSLGKPANAEQPGSNGNNHNSDQFKMTI